MYRNVHWDLFPTRVGMNRWTGVTTPLTVTVPHASGDEPMVRLTHEQLALCSPREWG